jgi:predicted NodU family carbamoyl transferase
MTAILGISAFYHDSAAALVIDGEIVVEAKEERFTRVKHDDRLPQHAIRYCLDKRDSSRKTWTTPALRQAADQIRTAVGNLPRFRACRVPFFPSSDATMNRTEAPSAP